MSEDNDQKSEEATLQGLKNLQRGVGEVAILMASHPAYNDLFLADLRRVVMPPVLLNQYRVIRNREDRTLGFISWALVSDAVLKRIMSRRMRLRWQDWQSGQHAVIVNTLSFTPAATQRMLAEVKKSEFAEVCLWISRPNAGAHEAKLVEYSLPTESH